MIVSTIDDGKDGFQPSKPKESDGSRNVYNMKCAVDNHDEEEDDGD